MTETRSMARSLRLTDDYGLTGLGFLLSALAAVFALIAVVVVIIISLSRHYGRITCRSFAEQTGRQTKFVVYNAFSTGDCLTPTANGKWIPTSNLREFGERP